MMGLARTIYAMLAALPAIAVYPQPAVSSDDAYVGEVQILASSYCPINWLPMDGRLLPISDYDALFSLIGTTYGGDGQITFGLPLAKPLPTQTNGTALVPCIRTEGIYPPQP